MPYVPRARHECDARVHVNHGFSNAVTRNEKKRRLLIKVYTSANTMHWQHRCKRKVDCTVL